jgi:hypothetical protein
MDIQFDTANLRRRLEDAGMSERQLESVAEAVGSAFVVQERKAELRQAELKRVLDQSMAKLQGDVYRLEAQLEFARKIAQTSILAVTGLAILLMFVL